MLGFMAQGPKSEGLDSFLKYFIYCEENKANSKLPTLFCVLCDKTYRSNSPARKHFFGRHLKRSIVFEDIRLYPCVLDHTKDVDPISTEKTRPVSRSHYHCPVCLQTTRCERLEKHMEVQHGVTGATFEKEYADLNYDQFRKSLSSLKTVGCQYNRNIASLTKLNAIEASAIVKLESNQEDGETTHTQEFSFENYCETTHDESIVEDDAIENMRRSLPQHLAELVRQPSPKKLRRENDDLEEIVTEVYQPQPNTSQITTVAIETNQVHHSVKLRDLMEELFRVKSSIRRLNNRVSDIEEQILVIMDSENQPNTEHNYGTKA